MKLPRGQIHVWRSWLPAGSELDALAYHLPPAEQVRAARFTDPDARERFVASHTMLLALLRTYLPFPFDRSIVLRWSPGEKPKLRWPHSFCGHEFSLSTSHEQVTVAVARRPIGVDIQWIEELRDLEGPLEVSSRAATWSRAEAVVKMRGTGLDELERFDVGGQSPLGVLDEDGHPLDITVTDLVVPDGYVGAIAGPGPYELVQRVFEYRDV